MPIILGTLFKFLLQRLSFFGFPLVAFNKILSAILNENDLESDSMYEVSRSKACFC